MPSQQFYFIFKNAETGLKTSYPAFLMNTTTDSDSRQLLLRYEQNQSH
jgi:hypothetical protein